MAKSQKATTHKQTQPDTQPKKVLDNAVSDLKEMPAGTGGKKYISTKSPGTHWLST